LCEVRGYVYAAYLARALLAEDLGTAADATYSRDRAARLKRAFNEQFWLPDRGWYALGLDRDKRPIDALASNMGHCLWAGIVDENKAEAVADRLLSPEMFTGWGVRTLATGMAAYNPMSYHNGSVWPPDNGIIVGGLMRYGFVEQAQRVALGILDVHDHSLAGPLVAGGRDAPTVVTVHGPVDSELGEYYRQLGTTASLVAISDRQRLVAPDLNWCAMVHHALRDDRFPFQEEKEDWVLFLGRCVQDKGMHVAIDAARAAGRRIVLAAKCSEPLEKEFFEAEIAPRPGPDTEWLGEVSAATKKDLLSRAGCLLFPIMWEEPFGVVMIEALACETPVVALRRGSVPEVVIDGLTGFVCDDPRDLPAALHEIDTIDPELCRKDVIDRFRPEVMAAGYEDAYRAVTESSQLVA
jgi:glycosyltransferase involved in cell wall biosynthesis